MLVAIMPTMVEACDRQGPKGPKLLLLWLFEKFSGVQVNTLDLCPCLCCQTDPLDQDHILLGDFYLLARRKERGASGQGRRDNSGLFMVYKFLEEAKDFPNSLHTDYADFLHHLYSCCDIAKAFESSDF